MSTWVLIRGLAREAGHWGDFAQRLERAMRPCRVVTPDLPGNGLRHHEDSPRTVEAMTSTLADTVRRSGYPPPYNLMALSLGAMVAVAWASRHPEEVSRLVLLNTSMRGFNPFYQRLRPAAWPAFVGAALPGRTTKDREHAILKVTSNRPEARSVALAAWTDIAQSHPVSKANLLRQLVAAARFSAPVHRPPMPILILASTEDRLASVKCSRALAKQWHCPLHEHPDAGHDLALDAGDWVIAQTTRWIAETQAPGRDQAK